MAKVQLLNEDELKKDLSLDYDVINTVEGIKEWLVEFSLGDFEEGETFCVAFCRNWSEYIPAGVFRFIRFDEETMVMVYEYIEQYYS
ncbi:hypothetical protein C5U40_03290 [Listeria monocytogenes]|uniref:hypothetical protein n=1 Tax=Listeria TaxID=1637 RepID=UPI000E6C19D4|nr:MULTISPECIES: hypothetical protein [Listeria]MBC1624153.1 hypothetical protein [Listeria welshimeri]MBC1952045.1 hypothetical protein [Listeria welshimeri]MBF2612542.1 hypothetical protein [Listeria welshimeri]MDZ06805.1 hypothetical protein [Listeria monocytogenes]RJA51395.1 hypothetical protein D3C24_06440 [Listeria monocytogenes]